MKQFFELEKHGTSVKVEVMAGITTFLTMAYILIVNPLTLAEAGMDFGAVFTATTLSALIATLIMALVAKLPFALAPGMGLNAFFALSVCIGMGKSWSFALTAVFLEGIIFVILTLLNIREAIINCIPQNIKKAISVGIGLFVAFIGLKNGGIIAPNDATYLQLGEMNPATILAIGGLIITSIMLAKKIKGALLWGILVTTVIGIPIGVTNIEGFTLFKAPPSLSPIFLKFEWSQILTLDMAIVLFTFLFVDMFDTVGTLIGVCTNCGMINEKGEIPRAKQALLADAIGTTVGAILGTSTVTTYVESTSGVSEGGRTGLTSLTTAGMFFLALFLSPLFLMVPNAATAPALILVGLFMINPIKEIEWKNITEAVPAFLTIIMMPLTFSISQGIVFGILSFVILKLATGKGKDISPLTYVISILFLLNFFI